MAPRWPKDGPNMPQDGPKMAQRWFQDGPKITHAMNIIVFVAFLFLPFSFLFFRGAIFGFIKESIFLTPSFAPVLPDAKFKT